MKNFKGGDKLAEEGDLYEALARLRDWLFQGADLAETIDKLVQNKTKVVTGTYELQKINWQQKNGDKGPYDMANDKGNAGNSDYETLKSDLKQHKGTMRAHGNFIWLFQDGTAIGKKAMAKKA